MKEEKIVDQERETVNKVDILDQGIQRFAVSGLSKERYDEAVNEEMLMDKHTGEFLIKNKSGVIVSADSANRFKAALNNAILLAEQTGICGNIYEVEIDDIVFPAVIPYNINLLNGKISLENNINRVLFNFDVSEHFAENGIDVQIPMESSVKITCKKGSDTFSITKKISDMNKFIIDARKYSSSPDALEITEIQFIPQESYVGNKEYKLVAHNLFITYNV